jgi:hypothetical protein
MLQDGRRGQGMPLEAVVRPLAMLVAGVAVSAALWHVLMLDPGVPAGQRGLSAERLSQGDRTALERLLGTP